MESGPGNHKWTCPLCSDSDSNLPRLHDHMLREHSNKPKLIALARLSIEGHSRGSKKVELLEKLEKIESGVSVAKTVVAEMASFRADTEVKKAFAKAVVEGNSPYVICEQEWLYEIVDVGIKIGFKAKKDHPTLHKPPSAGSFKISRATLTPFVDQHCQDIIQQRLEQVKQEAAVRGCTQVSDGRSNINNDPLLVFGVVAGATFFPQGAHNAGDAKKDALFLSGVAKNYLNGEDGLGDDTFGNVSDGAKACLNALDILEADEFLVPSRCQSHAVSLFIKAVATKVGLFATAIDKASRVIDFIRTRSRVNAVLKKKSEGNSVFRFVPTRFGTHVIGVGRMLRLQVAIQDTLSDSTYLEYKSSHTAKLKSEIFDPVEGIIRSVSFWKDLAFFHKIMLPAVKALRLMDSSCVRAKDVINIWENLEGRLVVALMQDDFAAYDVEVKQAVLKQYVQSRTDAHRPVFDAAWVLDPANRQRLRELASGRCTEDERETWSSRRDNTLLVLRTMVKRRKLLDQRQEFRKQSKAADSMKRAKVEAPGELGEFVLDVERHQAGWRNECCRVETEFLEYVSGNGQFSAAGSSSSSSAGTSSEAFWFAQGCFLNFYAIRIMNMAATISDVERLHKVYSGIHTPCRNRLAESRIDRLALARISSRLLSLDPKPFISQLDDFTSYSKEEEQTLVEWGQLQSQAVGHLARTIQEPSLDGSVRLDPPMVTGSSEMAPGSSALSSESEPLSTPAGVAESDTVFDESEVEIEETAECEPAYSGSTVGIESKAVRFSSGLQNFPLFLELFRN